MTRCKGGKIRYATEHDAQVALVGAIVRFNRGRPQRLERRYYCCTLCGGGWHLTSKPLRRSASP